MARITAFLWGILGLLFLSTGATPASNTVDNSIGDIINTLQPGLVSHINAFITVRDKCLSCHVNHTELASS